MLKAAVFLKATITTHYLAYRRIPAESLIQAMTEMSDLTLMWIWKMTAGSDDACLIGAAPCLLLLILDRSRNASLQDFIRLLFQGFGPPVGVTRSVVRWQGTAASNGGTLHLVSSPQETGKQNLLLHAVLLSLSSISYGLIRLHLGLSHQNRSFRLLLQNVRYDFWVQKHNEQLFWHLKVTSCSWHGYNN